MTEAIRLDLMTFPLTDLQLIEASAGTGKTFTIGILYLRLLLGLSEVEGLARVSTTPEQTPPPGLPPQEILVVTFTEAATEELRDRIRLRIGEMRRVFQAGESDDGLLQQLLDAYLTMRQHSGLSTEAALSEGARTLEDAARSMDEAAIFTIHGFCRRMLSQHAFESGALFESELIDDESPWLRLALLDFWRNLHYRLAEPVSAELLELWSSPDALLADFRSRLHARGLRLEPEIPELDLEQALVRRNQIETRIRQAWARCDDDIAALIAASGVNKTSYRKTSVPKWLEEIERWLKQPDAPLGKTVEILQKFRQSVLNSRSKSNPPELPLFNEMDDLLDQLDGAQVPLEEYTLQWAWREVGAALAKHKADRRLLAFDDLLSGLRDALAADTQQHLATAIRHQFPVALIDEFQDTDPQQYEIFSRLYTGQPGKGLIMIGDPKQAIYAFRGADIFTYIKARRSVSAPRTLDTNWRSTEPMVEAVNTLFEQCDSPFIYDADIPFQPVKASTRAGQTPLTLAGEPLAALQVWQCDQTINGEQYRRDYARATAAEIETLLADAKLGDAPLQAGQIAVLVRNGTEAKAVRDALAARRIPSVYLSNRDSVFGAALAMDLWRVLTAVLEPSDERALRAALATSLFALDAVQLDRLRQEESLWEAAVDEFYEYRDCWQRLGVLPMLHRLLQRRQLAVRLLQQMGGERQLTDLLHLGELLQQISTRIEGMAGLLRWFTDQVAKGKSEGDDQLLRLESDANLVTVVTIHKSKGLEYPVVFLPFVSHFRAADEGFYHDAETHEPVWALDKNSDALAAADQERLAEELRLLYVGLTRAVYRCYVGATELKVGNRKESQLGRSALGHLLGCQQRTLSQALAELEGRRCIDIQPVPAPEMSAPQPETAPSDNALQRLQAAEFNGRINRDWRLSSYSALSHHSARHSLPVAGVDLEVMDEVAPVPEPEQPQFSIFSFPRGARAGTFLHSLFEEVEFTDAHSVEADEIKRALLIRGGYGTEDEQPWLEVINQLMADVLNADLAGMALSSVTAADRLVEMEFMLPVSRLNAARLNQLVAAQDPLSARAAPLQFDQLRGMLKGFIDLVFRVDGRYYIADYKSNHLGDSRADYHPDALERAMLEHRYDLQYQLYSLALHRLLRQRLPDYDPARHLGGVFYLFLRGMQAGSASGVFYRESNIALVEALDGMFSGEEVAS